MSNPDQFGRFMFEAEWEDDSGKWGVMFAKGDTVPTDNASGYATGCFFIKKDNSDHSDLLYINIGDADNCNFNLVTVAAD